MLGLNRNKKVSGVIKASADDFIVEEIASNGRVLELEKKYSAADLGFQESVDGKFTAFILQKKDWNTVQALKMVARKFKRGVKSTSFAGTKDRTSVSTQLCSIFGVSPEQVLSAKIKDILINGAWRSSDKVEMGALLGNRFTVVVRGVEDATLIARSADALNDIFPNYFGEQRFGYRENNVQIGIDIMKGDLESAVMRFLTDTTNEKKQESLDARNRLAEEKDFQAAMNYFPQYLKYERALIEHLARIPTDFGGALRRLPRSLTLMFIHSVDAHIFNKELEGRIEAGQLKPREGDFSCKADGLGFPDLNTVKRNRAGDSADLYEFAVANIVGYEQETNSFEDEILEELGITKEMFRVKAMPELNCKGNVRVLFAPFVGFSCEQAGADAKLRFSLPSGSYATTLLAELVENKEKEK